MERIRVGKASWTDKTLIKSDTFYPRQVTTAGSRLRFYAARFHIPRSWAQQELPGITILRAQALRVLSRRLGRPFHYAAQSALAPFGGCSRRNPITVRKATGAASSMG